MAATPTIVLAASPQLGAVTRPPRTLPVKVSNSLGITHPRVVVRKVTVIEGSDGVEVHVEGNGPLRPVATVLSSPQRIVIDLPNVGCDRTRHLPVNSGDVQGVRISMFQNRPPITRVVLDMVRSHPYQLYPSGNSLLVKIEPAQTAVQPQVQVPVPQSLPSDSQKIASPVQAPPLQSLPSDSQTMAAPVPQEVVPEPAPPSAGQQPPSPTVAESSAPTDEQSDKSAAQAGDATPAASLPEVATLNVPRQPTEGQVLSRPEEEETTAHQAAKGKKPGVVRNISVSRENGVVEIHIEGSKPMRPMVTTLSNPERIVVDCSNVGLKQPRRIAINAGGVKEVDASLYLVNPLVTRVVVNLAHAQEYRLVNSGNTVTVRIVADGAKQAGSRTIQ